MANNGNYNIGRNGNINPKSILGQLDRERNRENYRYRVQINEAKVQKLREYAYRLIQKWNTQEKLVLIQSYGDISKLENRNNIEEINRQLVETLLLNLTEAQLNQIVQEVNQSSAEMVQQIKQLNKSHMEEARKGLANAKKNSYIRGSKETPEKYKMRTQNQLMGIADSINETGKFHVDYKIIKRMNSGLLKEVKAVLDTMNNAQLASTARDCGVDLSQLSKVTEVKDSIIEAVAKYVLLVTGQQKDGTLGVINADGEDGVKYILSKTSWAWVIGETPLTPKELVDLRKKAKEAKMRFNERIKSLGKKNNSAAKTKSREFQSLTGIRTKDAKEAAKLLEQNDTGFMRDWTFEQVVLKAAELGIDYDPRKTTLGELKLLIYGKVASDLRDANKRLKKADKGKNKFLSKADKDGSMSINTRQQLADINRTQSIISADGRNKNFGLLSASELSSMTKAPIGSGTGSSGGSIIEFDKDGKIKNAMINYAQAVWVVGQGSPADIKTQATQASTYEPSEIETTTKAAIELIKAGYLKPSDLNSSIAKLRKKIAKIQDMQRSNKRDSLWTSLKNDGIKGFASNLRERISNKTELDPKVDAIAKLNNIYQDAIKSVNKQFSDKDNEEANVGKKMEQYMDSITSAYNYLKTEIINNNIDPKKAKEEMDKFFNLAGADGGVSFNAEAFNDFKKERTDLSVENRKSTLSFIHVDFNGNVGDTDTSSIFAATPVYVLNKELHIAGGGISASSDGPVAANTLTGHEGSVITKLENGKAFEKNDAYKKLKAMSDTDINHKHSGRGYTGNALEHELGIVQHNKNFKNENASILYRLMNNGARNLLKTNVKLKEKAVTPVYLTNGFTEYLTNAVDKGFDDMTSMSSNIYSYLSTSMPVLFGGLQQAGLSFNLATVAAGATMALNAVVDAAGAVFDKILAGKDEESRVVRYATGGYGGVSQFIAGDSKNGKPNEELVSIDWDNKRYAVKPSGNADSTHMNSEERSRSFGIAFNEGKITYNRSLDGNTEDNVALKVYPVTPGINDKINVNGTEVSVMELMMGMYQSVSNIESLMGTNVEINKMIAANTINNGSSGGSSEIAVSNETFPTNLDSITRGD